VHALDCGAIARARRNDPDQWIDVQWDPATERLFQAAIQLTVANQRGVLANVASEIADAGSNIDSISMEEDRAVYTTMHLVLEVANRQHLARRDARGCAGFPTCRASGPASASRERITDDWLDALESWT
jgi:GTP pyrophosphokinase